MSAIPEDNGYELHDSPGRLDAVRSWLSNGSHLVDPRRRFGGHSPARQLLVVDRPSSRRGVSGWQSLASALQRHTIQSGLARLSAEERRVLTLAYMEGRTNREIAAVMGLSVATVRRRLRTALEHFEVYVGRTGAWLSALVLALSVYATGHATKVWRSAAAVAASANTVQRLAATVAVGTLTVAAMGVVAYNSHSAAPPRATHHYVAASPLLPLTMVATKTSVSHAPDVAPPPPVKLSTVILAIKPVAVNTPSATNDNRGKGCHGKPAKAPPVVPVGPRVDPDGPPGGCRL